MSSRSTTPSATNDPTPPTKLDLKGEVVDTDDGKAITVYVRPTSSPLITKRCFFVVPAPRVAHVPCPIHGRMSASEVCPKRYVATAAVASSRRRCHRGSR